MSLNENEFDYTYIAPDGSLAALKKRFRIKDSGRQILSSDHQTTQTQTPKPGDLLYVPKPKDEDWYARFGAPDWVGVVANPGETLPALVKRANTDSSLISNGRVLNATDAMTPAYVWHDWRNRTVRQGWLIDAGQTTPETDADIKKMKLKGGQATWKGDPGDALAALVGGEIIALPLKPVKVIDAPLTPGKPGDKKGPIGTIDVSHSDFAALQELLAPIEQTLNSLANIRRLALTSLAQCQGWLVGLNDIRDAAVQATRMWPKGPDAQGRGDFISAMGTLIGKASPLILDAKTCIGKVKPELVKEFKTEIDRLHTQITDGPTIALLAKVIPHQGDLPAQFHSYQDAPLSTVNGVCELAAKAAFWIGEVGPRGPMVALLEAAMKAMAKGSPPSSGAKSIIEFAAAVLFYPDATNMGGVLEDTLAPASCVGAIAQAYIALKIADAATKDGAGASDAIDQLGESFDRVAAHWKWTTFKSDYQLLAKSGFEGWQEFKEMYSPIGEAKEVAAHGEAEAEAATRPAQAAAEAVVEEKNKWTAARLGIAATNTYGSDKMKEAYEAIREMQDPSTRFTAQFRTAGTAFPAIWGLGKLAVKVGKGAAGLGKDWDGTVSGVLKTEKSAIDTLNTSVEGLLKLKIIVGAEAEDLALMLGRVSIVLGVAVEACEIKGAIDEKDILGACSHGALAAASVLFLIGGGTVVIVGTGFLVVGTAVIVLRSDIWKSEVAITFHKVFPADEKKDGATFEATCSKPFDLDGEIQAAKTKFKAATFSGFVAAVTSDTSTSTHQP
jgi:hypothetical protein